MNRFGHSLLKWLSEKSGLAASLLGVVAATGLGGCMYGPPGDGFNRDPSLRVRGTIRSASDAKPLAKVLVQASRVRDSLHTGTGLDTTGADGRFEVVVPYGVSDGTPILVRASVLDPLTDPFATVDTVFQFQPGNGQASQSVVDTVVDLDLGPAKK